MAASTSRAKRRLALGTFSALLLLTFAATSQASPPVEEPVAAVDGAPQVQVSVANSTVESRLGDRAEVVVHLAVDGSVAVGAGRVVVVDRADPDGTPWCEAPIPPTSAPGSVDVVCEHQPVTGTALLEARVTASDGVGGPALHAPPVAVELVVDEHGPGPHLDPQTEASTGAPGHDDNTSDEPASQDADDDDTAEVDDSQEPGDDTAEQDGSQAPGEGEATFAPLAWTPGGWPDELDAEISAVPARHRIAYGGSVQATVTLTNTGSAAFTVPEPSVESDDFGNVFLASDYCAGRSTTGSMAGVLAAGESRSVVCLLDAADVGAAWIDLEADYAPCEGCAVERFQESQMLYWGVRVAPAPITVMPVDPSLPPDAITAGEMPVIETLAGDDVELPAVFVTNETAEPITDAVFVVAGAPHCTISLGTLLPGAVGRRLIPACTLRWGVDIVDSGTAGFTVTGTWRGATVASAGDVEIEVEYPLELSVAVTAEPGTFDHGESFTIEVVVTNPTPYEVYGIWPNIGPAPSSCDDHPTELAPGATFSFSCEVVAVIPYGWAYVSGVVVPCVSGCAERGLGGEGGYTVEVNETPLDLVVTPSRAVVSGSDDVVIEATITNRGRVPMTNITGYLFDSGACDIEIASIDVGDSATRVCTMAAGTFSSIQTFFFVTGTGAGGGYADSQNVSILVNDAPAPELDGFTLTATPRSSVVAIGDEVAVDLVIEGPALADPLSFDLRGRYSGCVQWGQAEVDTPTRIELTCWIAPEAAGLLQETYSTLLTLEGSGGASDRYRLFETSVQIEVPGTGGLEISAEPLTEGVEWGTPQQYSVVVSNTGPNAVDGVSVTIDEEGQVTTCGQPMTILPAGSTESFSCTGSNPDATSMVATVFGTAAGNPVRAVDRRWFYRVDPWDLAYQLEVTASDPPTWPSGDVALTVTVTGDAVGWGYQWGYRVFSTDAPGCAHEFFVEDFELNGDAGTLTYTCVLRAGQDTLPPNGIQLSLYAYAYTYGEGGELAVQFLDTVQVPVVPVATTTTTTTTTPVVQPPPPSPPPAPTIPGVVPPTVPPDVAPPTMPPGSPPGAPPTTSPGTTPGVSPPPGPTTPPGPDGPPGSPGSPGSVPGTVPGGSSSDEPGDTRGRTFEDATPPPRQQTPERPSAEAPEDPSPIERVVASLGVTQSARPFAMVLVVLALIAVLLLGARPASNEQRRRRSFDGEDN